MRITTIVLASTLMVVMVSSGASAQIPARQAGDPGVGNAGQRQTRADAEDSGIEPMDRINNRIPNRVQNRVRNRIDRFYDPMANATAPFTVASDVAKGKRRHAVGGR